jgi:hypothetical protein
MKAYLECISCFINQAIRCVSIVAEEEDLQNYILKMVLRELSSVGIDRSPPEVAPLIYKVIEDITGCKDPYLELKQRSNIASKEIYPILKEMVESSDDRLTTALKLAIAGNIIDFGVSSSFDIMETIESVMRSEIPKPELERFFERLKSSKKVLYIADNSGEIFFDKLLVEEISNLDGIDLKFAVKDQPILNDAMYEDAKFAGINEFAEVITTGAGSPGEGL